MSSNWRRMVQLVERDEAFREIERAHRRDPNDESKRAAYVRALHRSGRADEAEKVELGAHVEHLRRTMHDAWRARAKRSRFEKKARESAKARNRPTNKLHYAKGWYTGEGVPAHDFDAHERVKEASQNLRAAADKYGGHEAITRAVRPEEHKHRQEHLATLMAAHGVHGTLPENPHREALPGWMSTTMFASKKTPAHEVQRRIANFQHGVRHHYDRASTGYRQGTPGHEDQHAVHVTFNDESPHTWMHGQTPDHEFPPGHGPEGQAQTESRSSLFDLVEAKHKPQPGVRDSEGRKIPKKYLRGLSAKKQKQMKHEIKSFRDKPDDHKEAYKPWTADKGVRPKKKSKATKAYHRMFGKKHESARNDSLFGRVFLEADNEDPHAHLKADPEFKPPSGPSDRYYSATKLHKVHRGTYWRDRPGQGAEQIASSRDTKSKHPLDIPLGSWQIDDGHKGSHGRDVEELRAYHPHELVPSIGEIHQWPPPAGKNPKEMLRDRARHADVERYADWLEKDHDEREARGETHTHARIVPLTVVKHFDKGDLRLSAGGGHRRLAAVALVNQRRAKQGKPPLRVPAWTGWDTAHPEGIKDWQGRPMRAGLTHELSQGQPVDRSYKRHEPEQSSKESVQEDEADSGERPRPPGQGDYQKGDHTAVERELRDKGHTYAGSQTMPAREAIARLGGPGKIPYLRDVHEIHADPQHPDRDWPIYQKVREYHAHLAAHPKTVGNLPPLVSANDQLKDGAHRLSTLSLLAKTHGDHWLDTPVTVRNWATTKSESVMDEDVKRNGKWDITHKDLSRGKMLLIHHPSGARRVVGPETARQLRSTIAHIERMWGQNAGPRRMYQNHHKHIDAVLQPFFENELHESWKKRLGALALGAACIAGSPGCAATRTPQAQVQRATPTRGRAAEIDRETEETIRRSREKLRPAFRSIRRMQRELPDIERSVRGLPDPGRIGVSADDERKSNEQFHRALLGESSEKGLVGKAKASGIPVSILRQVFNRGMAAWKTGHRPGVAQQQWAYGRVNSFITGSGGARKADADLWAKAKKAKKQEESVNLSRSPLLIENVCDSKKSGKPWRTPGGPKKFAVCADGKLVRFGDPNLEIKRDSAKRRKNFRARHNCASPGPRTKAKYWACKTWEKDRTVSDVVSEGWPARTLGGLALGGMIALGGAASKGKPEASRRQPTQQQTTQKERVVPPGWQASKKGTPPGWGPSKPGKPRGW